MDSFRKRVLCAQKELRAPKSQYNSFGKYAYRSCEDILEAVKPILVAYDLVLSITDDVKEIGGRIYVKATATLLDAEDNRTSCLISEGWAREPETKKGMDDSQITGTASSYARKYALNGLFLIDDNKDADTDEHARQTGKAQSQKPKAEAVPSFYTCDECGETVTAVTGKDGKMIQPEQIIAISQKRYGIHLCAACQREIAEAAQKSRKAAEA